MPCFIMFHIMVRPARRFAAWRIPLALRYLLLSVLVSLVSQLPAQYDAEFDGFIKPLRDAQIAFPESGILQSMNVEIGQRVERGERLAELDDVVQRSNLRIAETQAAQEGELSTARAEHELHLRRLQTLRRLAQENLSQPEELHRAETDLAIAAGRLQVAQEGWELRHLELERVRLLLERRTLRAPFAGIVTELYRETGEYVPPTDPSVLRLIAVDQMVAVVNAPADALGQAQKGARVRVRTTVPRAVFEATIQSVSPAIDGESGTVRVRAVFDNHRHLSRAGDRCTIIFSREALKAAQAPTPLPPVQR
jgi:RND family efflux transporter MFP subunit